jgi:hypothetical protein
VAHGEPRTENCRPPSLFIAQCDRGPPAMDGLGAPDQGAIEMATGTRNPSTRRVLPDKEAGMG